MELNARKQKKPFEYYLTEEDKIHIGLITYVAHAYYGMEVLHAPLEGKRTKFEQYKADKLGIGLSKGFPDLYLIYKGEELYLEIKTLTGVLSKDQMRWIDSLIKNGKDARVGYGFDECKEMIDSKFAELKKIKF